MSEVLCQNLSGATEKRDSEQNVPADQLKFCPDRLVLWSWRHVHSAPVTFLSFHEFRHSFDVGVRPRCCGPKVPLVGQNVEIHDEAKVSTTMKREHLDSSRRVILELK